jgi:peptidoglycan/xylan/chitin deacetylase (PgdA/CDA1 family)
VSRARATLPDFEVAPPVNTPALTKTRMDLNIDTENNQSRAAGGLSAEPPPAQSFYNDLFTFWKLPENWRAAMADLAEQSEREARHYLLEEYLDQRGRKPSPILKYYYFIKGVIPARLRHQLNSIAIRSRRRPAFPDWPCEDALLQVWRRGLAAALEHREAQDTWHIGFWPDGRPCAVVLTHDVESLQGLAAMERMADLEERYGFRSGWNLALEQYPIDWNKIDALRARGFEFGAHGLRHDGRLFRSEREFKELSSRIRRISREHDLRGFRAPSTLRRADWIPQLQCDFDSSFSDTDIFEPQPGGTCSIFPFFLESLVELPYTLPMDHTLMHVLKRELLPIWISKARWIASMGGMILTLVHPDYCGRDPYLLDYEKLLQYLAGLDNAWRALPSQAAAWWRQRAAAELHLIDGQPVVSGPGSGLVPRLVSQEALARLEGKAAGES